MRVKSFAAAWFAVLLAVAGGGAALSATDVQPLAPDEPATGPRDVDVAATQQNGTVTVTVTADGTALENVTVRASGERVGTTDADGRVAFASPADEELELALSKGDFEASVEYAVDDGTLRLVEEEYEYADPADGDDGEDDGEDDGDDSEDDGEDAGEEGDDAREEVEDEPTGDDRDD